MFTGGCLSRVGGAWSGGVLPGEVPGLGGCAPRGVPSLGMCAWSGGVPGLGGVPGPGGVCSWGGWCLVENPLRLLLRAVRILLECILV